MSKVIRTGRMMAGAGVVTLGRHEEGLHYDPGAEAESKEPRIDLQAMIDAREQAARQELDGQWEARLREEHDTTRVAGERQLAEATEAHQQELARVSQERYDEGHADGVASKEAEAAEAVQRMATLHEALKVERSQVLLDAEQVVLDLAVALSRRILRIEPVSDPKIVARTIREALHHLSERSNLLLKVHPQDLSIARRFAAAWVERVDADAVLRVLSSSHVDRGGAMIEGPEENVDARLATQLDTLHEALHEQVMLQHNREPDTPRPEAPTTGPEVAVEAEAIAGEQVTTAEPEPELESGDEMGDER